MSDREIGRKQRGDEGQKVNWEGRPSIKPVNSLSDRHGSEMVYSASHGGLRTSAGRHRSPGPASAWPR
jgi:hypothetical protein